MATQTLIILAGVLLVSLATRFLGSMKPRLWLLLGASYFLYASLAGSVFLVLLIISSLMNYAWGGLLRRRPTVTLLWTAIASNVLLLGFFKYFPPLAKIWPGMFAEMDFVQQIVLPLGMSFWTFQALSYLFDTYLEEDLDPSLLEFCLFMAFWPTVASGPVSRLQKLLPQFRTLPGSVREDFSIGIVRVIQGVIMKLLLAQLLATGVTSGSGVIAGFSAIGVELGALDVWALAVGFGFQLYFDFAGYSHIVIGVARLLGIRLEENFNRPYLATTPAVFWTRWHMSLSFWIRSYVYLPLATLRRNQWWRYAALVISMVIFGFWHDAKVTLILWGLYHGLVLVGHRAGQELSRRISFRLPRPLGVLLSWGATCMLMCVGHILFRVNSLDQARQMLQAVITPDSYGLAHITLSRDYYLLIALTTIGYFAYFGLGQLLALWMEWCNRRSLNPMPASSLKAVWGGTFGGAAMWISESVAVRKWWLLTPVLAFLLVVSVLCFFGESANIAPFIYTLF